MQECVRLCGSRVRFHRIPVNSGKGGAVYSGWDLICDSEWLGLLDADGSIPPHEVVRLLSYLDRNDPPDAFFAPAVRFLVARSRDPGAGTLVDACSRRLLLSQPESQCMIHSVASSCFGADATKRSGAVSAKSDLRSTSSFLLPLDNPAQESSKCPSTGSMFRVASCISYGIRANARSCHRHAEETRSNDPQMNADGRRFRCRARSRATPQSSLARSIMRQSANSHHRS